MKQEKLYLSGGRVKMIRAGMCAGIPIGIGYLAVAFSLGIAAKNAGLSAWQSFLASFLCHASAGEYAGFTSIAARATYIEIAIVTLIANARYLLLSCTMSQRLSSDMPLRHRMLMGFYLTDELFGIAVSRQGYLNPYYTYGAVLFASPCWAIGTAIGTIAGNLLPPYLVSTLSVALYGMFLAIIIPPSRLNKVICGVVAISFVLSYIASKIPIVSEISDGTRIIILTVIIASITAVLFPVKMNEEEKYAE